MLIEIDKIEHNFRFFARHEIARRILTGLNYLHSKTTVLTVASGTSFRNEMVMPFAS